MKPSKSMGFVHFLMVGPTVFSVGHDLAPQLGTRFHAIPKIEKTFAKLRFMATFYDVSIQGTKHIK